MTATHVLELAVRYSWIIAAIVLAIMVCIFHKQIVRFLLLPSPIVGYTLTKYLCFAAGDVMLFELLRMRERVEATFMSIDIVPIVLCLGERPIVASGTTHVTDYFVYTITGKQILLYIPTQYCNAVLSILESIWHAKPFHCILLNIPITSIMRGTTADYYCTLNTLYKVYNVNVCLFVLIEYDIPDSSFHIFDQDKRIGFEVAQYTLNHIYEQYTKHIIAIQNKLLTASGMIRFDVLYHLQLYTDKIVDLTFYYCNTPFRLAGVYFYTTDTNTSLNYVLDNVINSSCSAAVFAKRGAFARVNRMITWLTILVTLVSGIWVVKQYTACLNYSDAIREVHMHIDDPSVTVDYIDHVLQYKPFSITKHLFASTCQKNKLLANDALKNIYYHLVNSNTTLQVEPSISHPTNTVTYTEYKKAIKTYCNIYSKLYKARYVINRFNDYSETLTKNILELHTQWLNSWFKYSIINLQSDILDTLNKINTNRSNVNDYQSLLTKYNTLVKLLGTVPQNWWMYGNLGDSYTQILHSIKQLPDIGEELYTTLTNQTQQFLEQFKKTLLTCRHELIKNKPIFEITNENDIAIFKFTSEAEEFMAFINNVIHNEVFFLPYTTVLPPVLTDQQYICWDEINLLRLNEYKNDYFALLIMLKQQPFSLRTELTKLSAEILYEHINYSLLNTAQILSVESDTQKIANNIAQSYDMLKHLDRFSIINLQHEIPYLKRMIKHNLVVLKQRIDELIRATAIKNYTFINNWNASNNLFEVMFGRKSSQAVEVIESMLRVIININNEVIEPILKVAIELAPEEYKYFQYINSSVNAYKSGTRSDLTDVAHYFLSLANPTIASAPIEAHEVDSMRVFAYHHAMCKNTVQQQMNSIILKNSCVMWNDLVQHYQKYLQDAAPFRANAAPANIGKIIEFVNKCHNMQLQLKNDTQFLHRHSELKEQIHFINTIVEFLTVDNGNINLTVHIQDINQDELPLTAIPVNANMIVEYTHVLGTITYTDPLEVTGQYSINKGYQLQITTAGEHMEIAPSSANEHITTEYNKIKFNYNRPYGLFSFIEHMLFMRTGTEKQHAILRIPVSIFDASVDLALRENSTLITYLKVHNWPNISNVVLTEVPVFEG
jgi:hypothetical protein